MHIEFNTNSPQDGAMTQAIELRLTAPMVLSVIDDAALIDLYARGTPANTLRAYERDLIYLTAWKEILLKQALNWPESESTALSFLLDHARDLRDADPDDPARMTAETLIKAGFRKSLACPAPCPQIRPPDHP